jgi:hypothetical protein
MVVLDSEAAAATKHSSFFPRGALSRPTHFAPADTKPCGPNAAEAATHRILRRPREEVLAPAGATRFPAPDSVQSTTAHTGHSGIHSSVMMAEKAYERTDVPIQRQDRRAWPTYSAPRRWRRAHHASARCPRPDLQRVIPSRRGYDGASHAGGCPSGLPQNWLVNYFFGILRA